MSFHRLLMSAALAAGIAIAAPLAAAREPIRPLVAPVVVDGVDVEQVAVIGAGVPLNFTVFGTPGALVVLRIDGGRRTLELREAEPGVYEGSYLIDGLDAIRPESRVSATLQKDGAVAYAALDEPLLLPRGTVPWGAAAAQESAPPIGRTPVPQAAPVEPVRPVLIPAAPQPVPRAAVAATPPLPGRTPCDDCAVVESVRAVEAAPRGGVIGTIGGAIAGALLGNELGEAHQRRMLAVLGAIGGALAGRQIERHATRSTEYEVDLRLADGTLLKRRYDQAPPFAPGATIRLGTPLRGAPSL
ncbi:MAG TPA: glycine zipper 2TM domain-containing protein [Caldimonas sp.]|nr:glycine zipper 2TM domain-containing protein [Caldimonas sp.]